MSSAEFALHPRVTVNQVSLSKETSLAEDLVTCREASFPRVGFHGHRREQILGWVLEDGYTGLFDLEIGVREEGHVDAIKRGAEHVGALLERLGA